MNMRRLSWALLLLLAWCAVLCLVLYRYADTCYVRPLKKLLQVEVLDEKAGQPVTSTHPPTAERTNIFFLKTHKCGSSTVQNILMRFGFLRHLNFVLPGKNNYLGHPQRFEPKFISPDFRLPNVTFNIFTHHTRYNYAAVKGVMKPDAAFVTILRQPADLFESLYTFYHMERVVNNESLKSVIDDPDLWRLIRNRTKTMKFGANQMAFDLGYDADEQPDAEDPVTEFIRKIDSEFDLVMIMEHMEVSLVLLCDLMDWPLEHAVFLKLNARPSRRVVKLTPGESQRLLELNLIDAELYGYFLHKFKRRVRDYGYARMKESVDKLLNLNSDLMRNCVDKPNYSGYAGTLSYSLRSKDSLCFFATYNELPFTDLIRNDQIRRFEVMEELDALMADTID